MSDGTRTRGHLDHNQVLYQLSYTHHVRLSGFPRPAEKKCTGSEGVLAPALIAQAARLYCAGRTCFAAIVLAVSESGPGCGTKIASR